MTKFPEAEARLLNKKICMNCGASNAPRAERCRRCRSKNLRIKAKEGRGV
ncbi:LSU ribosomal protein L40E [Thermoplasmatales archaeon SCGC AB-539-N05]|nr:LSU ribosomal protein L40E [Thermoplasmatales archaeon SCGC AB-539-N05]